MSGITSPRLAAIVIALAGQLVSGPAALAQADDGADVCLELSVEGLPDGTWEAIVAAVSDVVAARPALFPDPAIVVEPALDGEPPLTASARLDVHAGHAEVPSEGTSVVTFAGCRAPGLDWSARFGRSFLEASADLMLMEAPTTPGIASDVVLEWHPEESRVRTLLSFAGPFDIPSGRCWVDDVLSIDPVAGLAVASGDQGVETSLFAEGACGRFFDYLPDGGAGQQAVTLLPLEVQLDGSGTLRLVAAVVAIEEDAIVVGGSLELPQP